MLICYSYHYYYYYYIPIPFLGQTLSYRMIFIKFAIFCPETLCGTATMRKCIFVSEHPLPVHQG